MDFAAGQNLARRLAAKQQSYTRMANITELNLCSVSLVWPAPRTVCLSSSLAFL